MAQHNIWRELKNMVSRLNTVSHLEYVSNSHIKWNKVIKLNELLSVLLEIVIMKVLVFDTETTGLPPKYVSTRETFRFPYVVQLSWMVLDTGTNKIVSFCDYIIQLPQYIEIPQESANIHGINTDIMREKGENILPILQKFKRLEYDLKPLRNMNKNDLEVG